MKIGLDDAEMVRETIVDIHQDLQESADELNSLLLNPSSDIRLGSHISAVTTAISRHAASLFVARHWEKAIAKGLAAGADYTVVGEHLLNVIIAHTAQLTATEVNGNPLSAEMRAFRDNVIEAASDAWGTTQMQSKAYAYTVGIAAQLGHDEQYVVDAKNGDKSKQAILVAAGAVDKGWPTTADGLMVGVPPFLEPLGIDFIGLGLAVPAEEVSAGEDGLNREGHGGLPADLVESLLGKFAKPGSAAFVAVKPRGGRVAAGDIHVG